MVITIFYFNILSWLKNRGQVRKKKLDKKNQELLDQIALTQYKSTRYLLYIKGKYPNCPNSDYMKLINQQTEKINRLYKKLR